MLNRRFPLAVLTLALAVPTPFGSISSGAIEVIDVTFAAKLSPESAVAVLAPHGLQGGQLRHAYEAGGQTWTGFFPFKGSDAPKIAREYREAHAAMTADVLDSLNKAGQPRSASITASARAALEAGSGALRTPVVIGALGILAAGSVDRVRADSRVSGAVVRTPTPRVKRAQKVPGALMVPLSGHSTYDQWVPDDHYITVQPSSMSGQRYISNDFVWGSGRSLYFGGDYGFEADFLLSRNEGTYLTRDVVWIDIPDVYASTNLPWDSLGNPPYLDTRYGDYITQEISYTMGTPGGNQILTGVWYNTYIRGRNGDADNDWGRHYPDQTVFRGGPEPRDTWSMYPHAACYSSWSIPIPVVSWHWNRYSGPWACN